MNNHLLMKTLILLFVAFTPFYAFSQGIHKEQLDEFNAKGQSSEDYYLLNMPKAKPSSDRAGCTLNKIVYGWHPYWSNGLQVNYDWSLLSHFCYFSYEVDAATGNALSTHSFATTASVTEALANGVRVDLCVTLFSSHATLLTSTTAKQNLIDQLISLITARGAHGVNIDFEGLPLSQKTNFTNFMNDLANQMHAAIPGSQVSSVLYAVDWSDVIDVVAMTQVDFFVMMGYDYYWSGSSNAGPGDPLFHFGSTYNYTLSKSITYYLDKGLSPSKFVVGLPYYGREWPVSSTGIPAPTTGSGVAKFFNDVKDNVSGNYSAANRNFDNQSYSCYYEFNSGGLKQCFITEAYEMDQRMDLVNKRGLAGMGIWALGYDDGYNDFWDAISNNFSDCAITPCYDTLFDIGGGPNKNYYDDEDYTYTISPPGADQVMLNFSSFNLELNWDYLYIYDGPSTTSPQFPGSPYTGTTSPGSIASSTGSVTLRFTSDGATVSTGFKATYQCIIDSTPQPVCAFSLMANEICIIDSILLNNTSTDASSYNWSGAGVSFDNDTLQFPSASFATSGTYTIQLIATGAGGADTLSQNFSVIVVDLPVSGFTVSSDTVYLPSAFVGCTNASTNADSYLWDFGDGNSSVSLDPWNSYAGAGTYTIMLIANNGTCPADTSTMTIVVNSSIGISENSDSQHIVVFPNPVTNNLFIQSERSFDKVLIKDVSGKLILESDQSWDTKQANVNLSGISSGVYFMELMYRNHRLITQKIIKK